MEGFFSQWGILTHDQQIGHTMRALGILATVAWLAYCIFKSDPRGTRD